MDALDRRMKQDIENSKLRLEDTRQKLAETLNRITKTETEYEEGKTQWSRRLKILQGVEGNQYTTIAKLNNQKENLMRILLTRQDEEVQMKNSNEALRQEIQVLEENTERVATEFTNKLLELNEDINTAYLQLQNVKDAETLLEMGTSSLPPEERLPFVEDVLTKRKERQKELNEELMGLEENQKELEKEIGSWTEELIRLKQKHTSLNQAYILAKKIKEGKA